jgi:allophanate hydrolase
MTMTKTARAIADCVSSGAVSARVIMAETLERIAAYGSVQPYVWISRVPDEKLLATAAEIDLRIAAGEDLPLAGVPFAVKDNIDVAPLPTTAACAEFAYEPAGSAFVVERLVAAGAICVGKTNLDQFATGLVGTRSPYGTPHCVFNHAYISGGSSSGSGVAVAAGLVPFALGTDTAGSGRVPAAINGCVGFKPSRGRWSSGGMLPACRTLDCVSVFATDVKDAALVDRIVRGFDADDPFSKDQAEAAPWSASPVIGVPCAEQLAFFGDGESAALFHMARQRLAFTGARLVEIDIAPLLEAGKLLYEGPWVAERTAAIGEFMARHPDAVHPVVASIVKNGSKYSAVDAFRGIYALQSLAQDMAAIWQSVEGLLLPTTPTVYPVARVLEEPFGLNASMGLYTAATNLLDLCAIALPAGFRVNGTGFGVSLLGPAFADAALLDFGERYMSAGTDSRPPLDLAGPETVTLAVVGAHLEGMPLHGELTAQGARLLARTSTAPCYRLYAMAGTTPPKPALVHVGNDGFSIAVEVYALPVSGFGRFVTNVPPPLAIGTLELVDGTNVKGFVAEPRALLGADDISSFGGWSNYVRTLS